MRILKLLVVLWGTVLITQPIEAQYRQHTAQKEVPFTFSTNAKNGFLEVHTEPQRAHVTSKGNRKNSSLPFLGSFMFSEFDDEPAVNVKVYSIYPGNTTGEPSGTPQTGLIISVSAMDEYVKAGMPMVLYADAMLGRDRCQYFGQQDCW